MRWFYNIVNIWFLLISLTLIPGRWRTLAKNLAPPYSLEFHNRIWFWISIMQWYYYCCPRSSTNTTRYFLQHNERFYILPASRCGSRPPCPPCPPRRWWRRRSASSSKSTLFSGGKNLPLESTIKFLAQIDVMKLCGCREPRRRRRVRRGWVVSKFRQRHFFFSPNKTSKLCSCVALLSSPMY